MNDMAERGAKVQWGTNYRICCLGLDSVTEAFMHPTYQHAYLSKHFQTASDLVYNHLPSLGLLQ